MINELQNMLFFYYILDLQFNKALMNTLLDKTNFFYYTNTYFKYRQGLEIINFYVKDMDSFILYTNLKNPENVYKLNGILNIFRKSRSLFTRPYSIIVVDNDRVILRYKYLN